MQPVLLRCFETCCGKKCQGNGGLERRYDPLILNPQNRETGNAQEVLLVLRENFEIVLHGECGKPEILNAIS